FSFNHTSTTQIYPLSLHDALPIFHLGPEYRVEMRRQYDRRGPFAVLPQPPVDITRVIDHDVAQADRAEQLRHVRGAPALGARRRDRKSTRLNSSHVAISYAVFCLK